MNQAAARDPEHRSGPPAARRRLGFRLRPSRAGGRYTRFVSMMRIVLPVVAAVLVLLVVIWPQLNEDTRRFRLMEQSGISLKDGGDQQAVNPRYTGTDAQNRPYSLTADSAVQSQTMPDAVTLAFPKADITMKSGAWIALSAQNGLYHRDAKTLDLNGDVTMFHDSGFEMRTASARIDFNDSGAVGNQPVEGHGPMGTVQATGFRVIDGGKQIWFTGRSKLVFWPSARKDGKK
jgi:lipopolysaccharide export system protein LptC